MSILSIDIGGTNLRFALINPTTFEITHRADNIRTPTQDREDFIQTLQNHALNFCEDKQEYPEFITVSSTGLVNPADGSVVALSPKTLPIFAEPLSIRNLLHNTFPIPVSVLNDAQAATYAEFSHLRESQPDLQNFMFLTVSTGTGSGLVLNGQLHQGKTGKAGHLGLALKSLPGEKTTLDSINNRIEDVTCGRFVDAANGNLDISAKEIALLIANKTIELDLEFVAVGGGVAIHNETYIANIQKHLTALPDVYQSTIKPAFYGDDAGLIGAARFGHAQLQPLNPNYDETLRPQL